MQNGGGVRGQASPRWLVGCWLVVAGGCLIALLTAVSGVDLHPPELAKSPSNLFAQRFDRLPLWVVGIHKSLGRWAMIEWLEGGILASSTKLTLDSVSPEPICPEEPLCLAAVQTSGRPASLSLLLGADGIAQRAAQPKLNLPVRQRAHIVWGHD